MKVIRFKEINSTNTYLKDNYQKMENLSIVVADHQTDGRGRLGRTWVDNDDLLFSILIKEYLEKPTDYSLLIASKIVKVLVEYNPTVKWPNDIMIGDKKVCGILLESISKNEMECVIIGVGINVNTSVFPDDLLVKATSLKNERKKDIDKESLLQEITKTFEKEYCDYQKSRSDFLENIRKNFYLTDKNVSFIYNGEEKNGIVKGINNDGFIIITLDNNETITLSSGEVTLSDVYKRK